MSGLDFGQWDVFLLAGRYTLLEQTPLDALFPACQVAGTTIICGGPFNSGVLVGREMWNYAKAPANVATRVDKLKSVAANHNIPLPAAALQFPLAHPIVSCVIPGALTHEQVLDNRELFDFPIPSDCWAELQFAQLIHENAPLPLGD